ncbi:tRNA methyltransferase complex subunit Cpd1 [Calocera viscosa TUFC12733]|uniref:tRNA (adenine(58)-N(1))-methyltransferase catalytic subunit TRM61 n=1 Tax=Calocera viscosa (strain TUFC12733) TaxID=1330018 RepID=A0A167MSC9_CALVF|nr:tRNA methyltransferase complex subunit Cpd1 [Calocera viscosa TUFC12733]
MWNKRKGIEAGDTVILWLTRDAVQPLVVTPGKELNNRFGVYRHSDFIGKLYGSKISSRNGRGFIHVLRPTPELWTLALPHRTQILYVADIAFITAMLGLKPGSIVLEAGTGSGSFSHSLARTIGPHGALHTFEFHESRVNRAREEFQAHGLSDIIDISHRNVCKDGFGLENAADAIFLDLPAPWDAIPHVRTALKKDRAARICCFSPCMEQVLRTVAALNESTFSDVTMYETLLRPSEVQPISLQSVDTVADKLKIGEVQKEARRLRQIEASVGGQKRKLEELDSAADSADSNDGTTIQQQDPKHNGPALSKTTIDTAIVSKAPQEVRGHTSYLTFATLLPVAAVTLWIAEEKASADGLAAC